MLINSNPNYLTMNCLVCLENIEFFAYHGFQDEEQTIGNRYSVDINIETDFMQAAQRDKLSQTINYGEVYEIVKAQMQISARLLEYLAYQIITKLFEKYQKAYTIEVVVRKHNPPIGGVCSASKIVLKANREEWLLSLVDFLNKS